jgi:hypothetical protein
MRLRTRRPIVLGRLGQGKKRSARVQAVRREGGNFFLVAHINLQIFTAYSADDNGRSDAGVREFESHLRHGYLNLGLLCVCCWVVALRRTKQSSLSTRNSTDCVGD